MCMINMEKMVSYQQVISLSTKRFGHFPIYKQLSVGPVRAELGSGCFEPSPEPSSARPAHFMFRALARLGSITS